MKQFILESNSLLGKNDGAVMVSRSNWLVAAVTAIIYCFNQYAAVNSLNQITLLIVVVFFIIAVFALRFLQFIYVAPVLFFVTILGFPEFAANPYIENYLPPFRYAKVIVLIVLLTAVCFRVSLLGLFFIAVSFAATIFCFLFGQYGQFWTEIWYVFAIAYIINSSSEIKSDFAFIFLCDVLERFFYFFLPIISFIHLTGLYDVRDESGYAYFYGHWVGLAAGYAIYSAASGESNVFDSRIIRWTLLMLILYLSRNSFQSIHIIMIIAALLLGIHRQLIEGRDKFNAIIPLFFLSVLAIFGFAIIQQQETSSWLFLKVNQVYSFFTGDFVSGGNSVLIRISQLITFFEQGNAFTIFFGNGISSTYLPTGALWDYVLFDDSTYPARELETEVLQFVHEPIVMIFKWVGLVGLVVVCVAIWKYIKDSHPYQHRMFFFMIAFLATFTATPHTSLMITGFFTSLFWKKAN